MGEEYDLYRKSLKMKEILFFIMIILLQKDDRLIDLSSQIKSYWEKEKITPQRGQSKKRERKKLTRRGSSYFRKL